MEADEYRELVVETRDALYALLRNTEPGTGLELHRAYSHLGKMIDAEREPGVDQHKERIRKPWLPPDWCDVLSVAERAREVLEILSKHRLTLGELTERLQKKHDPDVKVYLSHVRSAVTRLYKERELDRKPETYRNKTRYRYFKRTELDGPIVDLDRAFHENEGDA